MKHVPIKGKISYLLPIIFLLSLFQYVSAQSKYIATKPSWVKELTLPNEKMDTKALSDGYYYFFSDYQINVSSEHYYYHYAYKIYNPNGVESASSLLFTYNPSFEKIKIHSVLIHRNGEAIDKTKSLDIKVLQRETRLESNIYDERITLSVFLEDVRQGDIVEYDYSIIGDNPIFDKKFYFSFYANAANEYKQIYCRVLKPHVRNLYVTCLNKKLDPVYSDENSMECMTWDIKSPKPYTADVSAPQDYDPYNLVEISEYNNWKDVSEWATKVFETNVAPSKELAKKIDEFKALSSKDEQVMAALHFVQNEIRYMGIEIGVNSHKPRSPNDVFRTRYGDCKDKVQLYRCILTELGMTSRPVLVHSVNRTSITKRAVSPHQFDHVIVEVTPKSWHYYFDPTINFQEGNLQNYYTPNYGAGLVVGDEDANIIFFPYTRNFDLKLKEHFIIRSIGGEATLMAKSFYHGYSADYNRSTFANTSNYDIADTYLKYYKSVFGKVERVGELVVKDSKSNNIFTVTENYKIKKIWNDTTSKPGIIATTFSAHFLLDELNKIDLSLEARKDPLYLPHPIWVQHIIDADLPEDWGINTDPVIIENKHFYYKKEVTYIISTHKLSLNFQFKSKQSYVLPENYKEFRGEMQSVFDDLYYTLYYNKGISNEVENSSIHWLALFIVLVTLIICFFAMYFLWKSAFYVPANTEVPRVLGGLLIGGILYICLNVSAMVYSLVGGNYFSKQTWLVYTDSNSLSYLPGYAPTVVMELIIMVAMILFSVFIVVLMIKNSHLVPKVFVAYIIIAIIYNMVDSVAYYLIIDNGSIYTTVARILIPMCAGGIFIPYFLTSERSKETFIK